MAAALACSCRSAIGKGSFDPELARQALDFQHPMARVLAEINLPSGRYERTATHLL